ncbi:MAG: DNA cytosine methyltransferase [Clostridiales bacterium]|nr:DNA cytosine methyltransferase [Clostridiales bacterium]
MCTLNQQILDNINWDKRPIAIDLFCGVGGMSLGFEQAGFNVVAAVDKDPIHTYAHTINFPDCQTIHADVAKLTASDIRNIAGIGNRQIDVVFGGPPCQGFSLIGKRRSNDPRNMLFFEFARLVAEISPNYFVLENVDGLLYGNTLKVLDEFIKRMKAAKYEILEPVEVLNACNYGVPQRRKRLFVIGCKTSFPLPKYPIIKTNYSTPTVKDAIYDLPNIDEINYLLYSDLFTGKLGSGSTYALLLRSEIRDKNDLSLPRVKNLSGLSGCSRIVHSTDVRKRFSMTTPGTTEPISRFYRLKWDDVSNTIRAGTERSHGGYTAARPIHPQYSRCITVREAARIQSFPDWFEFHHTKSHAFRQVGNAVPPLLARAIAKEVVKCLNVVNGGFVNYG